MLPSRICVLDVGVPYYALYAEIVVELQRFSVWDARKKREFDNQGVGGVGQR